ncbi:HU family DNA-binding protein [Bacteroides sp. 224]|uniref:HU family DNA-binding protein n=1 Tax=Bacteroides sp. 224 TaxID=2302936 RepID=UPI0013CF4C51|nr:HU family DNA-binding protein [Bacteroides sp. 224]NDV64978.1 DNA-binding protein [Bacteroides sp. 224]
MPVPYKKMKRKDPRNAASNFKYYPQLVTLGNSADLDDVAYLMKEASSLSLGDIKSVLTNFSECMRTLLYGGQSVNIKDFGVFSLGARTFGSESEKECGVKNIKTVKINFRASNSVKPNLNSTRAGDRIKFYDVATGVTEEVKDDNGDNTGGGNGDNGGGDEFIDPSA